MTILCKNILVAVDLCVVKLQINQNIHTREQEMKLSGRGHQFPSFVRDVFLLRNLHWFVYFARRLLYVWKLFSLHYYVFPKNKNMTWASIHLGHKHYHPVRVGICREIIESVKQLISNVVRHMLNVKILAIQLATSKEFLAKHLLGEENDLVVLLTSSSLDNVMNKFCVSSSPNIWYTINNFKNVSIGNDYIDNILDLKRSLRFYYIKENVFPHQGWHKVYLFKMYTRGPTSGVDLLKCM